MGKKNDDESHYLIPMLLFFVAYGVALGSTTYRSIGAGLVALALIISIESIDWREHR